MENNCIRIIYEPYENLTQIMKIESFYWVHLVIISRSFILSIWIYQSVQII